MRYRTMQLACAATAAVAVFVLAPLPGSAATQVVGQRIAYVDLDRVTRSAQPLRDRIDDADRRITPLYDQLETMFQKMNELERESRGATVLSKERKDALDREISKLTGDITALRVQIDRELENTSRDAIAAMSDLLRGAVEAVARQRGFSLVLRAEDVLFGEPDLDITQAVIERLNAGAAPAAANPAPGAGGASKAAPGAPSQPAQ